jgi:nucleotide-binding universal stress UspA family protein
MSTIVVGIDGSENSRLALEWARDEAKLRGVTLHVVHSWTFPLASRGADGLPHADIEAAARRVLDDAVARCADAGIEVTSEIASESAAQALIRASQGAELLVVGSRGVGGFRGLLLGSVTQQVTHHARCPVVIVPHPERAETD